LSGLSVLVAMLSLLQVQNAEKGGAAGVIVAGKAILDYEETVI